jgi:hypothetical protein
VTEKENAHNSFVRGGQRARQAGEMARGIR